MSVGTPVRDLDTPVLLVDLDKLERNIERFAAIFKKAGVNWRPHTKGVKVPAIAHMELTAGAFGITCAKLGEAEVMAAAGIKNILIANQVVGPIKAARLASLSRRVNVTCAIDSEDNARELNAAALTAGTRIKAVIEVDVGQGRCGVGAGVPAVALSRLIHSLPGLDYRGVMAWEAQARKYPEPEKRRAVAEEAVGVLVDTAGQCRAAGLPVEIVSCGGTGTHEYSPFVKGVTEIQAGGGILSDMRYAGLGLDQMQEFALTILSTVVSRPNPTRIVTDSGFKTMSGHQATPKPIGLEGVSSLSLSAEHCTLELAAPNESVKVGDKVEFIVGYGDSTVCLHDEMYGTRNGIVEVVWPILARGKLR
ncbi:MAG: DSD1 family PLP-dependent enzyme [Bacteroidetes bacterium]|nr:DSD1 family PLP-dependent enzyme [Bacteroidota bacterium]